MTASNRVINSRFIGWVAIRFVPWGNAIGVPVIDFGSDDSTACAAAPGRFVLTQLAKCLIDAVEARYISVENQIADQETRRGLTNLLDDVRSMRNRP